MRRDPFYFYGLDNQAICKSCFLKSNVTRECIKWTEPTTGNGFGDEYDKMQFYEDLNKKQCATCNNNLQNIMRNEIKFHLYHSRQLGIDLCRPCYEQNKYDQLSFVDVSNPETEMGEKISWMWIFDYYHCDGCEQSFYNILYD